MDNAPSDKVIGSCHICNCATREYEGAASGRMMCIPCFIGLYKRYQGSTFAATMDFNDWLTKCFPDAGLVNDRDYAT